MHILIKFLLCTIDSPPLCLGCLVPVDCTVLCPVCSWPVCSADCASLQIHKTNECEVFAQSGVKFQVPSDCTDINPQYECITPLRVLLAKKRYPERWNKEVSNTKCNRVLIFVFLSSWRRRFLENLNMFPSTKS